MGGLNALAWRLTRDRTRPSACSCSHMAASACSSHARLCRAGPAQQQRMSMPVNHACGCSPVDELSRGEIGHHPDEVQAGQDSEKKGLAACPLQALPPCPQQACPAVGPWIGWPGVVRSECIGLATSVPDTQACSQSLQPLQIRRPKHAADGTTELSTQGALPMQELSHMRNVDAIGANAAARRP